MRPSIASNRRNRTSIAGASSICARVSASRKFQIEFASGTRYASERQAQKAHEGKPVLDQVFRPLIGQRVARLQDQDLEHQHVIIGRAATLGPFGPRDGTLQFEPECLEIYQRTQPLQIVALGGELSESLLHVKEPRLPPP
jgi:hypothetical protein